MIEERVVKASSEKEHMSQDEILLSMTEMYEEFLQKDTENKLAMAEIYEMLVSE